MFKVLIALLDQSIWLLIVSSCWLKSTAPPKLWYAWKSPSFWKLTLFNANRRLPYICTCEQSIWNSNNTLTSVQTYSNILRSTDYHSHHTAFHAVGMQKSACLNRRVHFPCLRVVHIFYLHQYSNHIKLFVNKPCVFSAHTAYWYLQKQAALSSSRMLVS